MGHGLDSLFESSSGFYDTAAAGNVVLTRTFPLPRKFAILRKARQAEATTTMLLYSPCSGIQIAMFRTHLIYFVDLLLETLQFLNESADGHVPGSIYVHSQEGRPIRGMPSNFGPEVTSHT